MRSLVTGGAGFIGSHLVDALLAAGDEVVVIDNFATGREENLDDARAKGRPLTVWRLDVAGAVPLASYFAGIDRVFHLAALADIVPSVERPADYHRANVDGTVAVLEAARAAGVKRVVYAASSSCYGIPDLIPTPETAAIRPQYPYALTKWIGEQYAMHWHRVYGLPVTSCRLFNVYGPRSRTTGAYGAMFGVFLAQRLAGAPLTIVGDGSQMRDFTHVEDVVRGLILASERGTAIGRIFNLGTGHPTTVAEIAARIGGTSVRIPRRPGEPDVTCADATLARILLGWEPWIGIQAGIARMLEEIERWRDAPVWTPETIAQATAAWFSRLS